MAPSLPSARPPETFCHPTLRTAGLSSGHPSQRRRSPSATPPPSLVSLRLSSANSSLEQDLPFDSPCRASARKRPGDCLSLSRIARGDPGRKGAPSGFSVPPIFSKFLSHPFLAIENRLPRKGRQRPASLVPGVPRRAPTPCAKGSRLAFPLPPARGSCCF